MQQPSPPQQVYVHVGEKPPAQVFYQPQAMPAMVVVPGGGGNRNAKNLPMDSDGREWSHGLCDCCSDVGTSLGPSSRFTSRFDGSIPELQVSSRRSSPASFTLKINEGTNILTEASRIPSGVVLGSTVTA
ncbi:hypothetical protein PTI98_000109 [Pleurotus ostreatus]|nr:hypothetical protein PTI98_000109 [Pleurotus ostreatus]